MAKYAHFDHTAPSPQPVRGWFDTDLFDYGKNLPDAADLLRLTDAEWDARMPEPSGWTHKDGVLSPRAAPPKEGVTPTAVATPKAPVG
jgi:hypothetical protein